jgi:hypothetical protein
MKPRNTHARRPRLLRWLGFAVVLLPSLLWLAVHAATPAPIHEPAEGQKLAGELRSMVPSENASFSAALRLSVPGQDSRSLPIQTRVVLTPTNWMSIYEAQPTNAPAETLIIRRLAGQPPVYEWRRGEQLRTLTGSAATNRFAGSDFALLDLGMDFFNWPTQSVVQREMRKGRGCDVLESRPGQATLYSRVLSWIDQESRAQGQPGLLMAEGYDANGRLLKEFEIKGFKKVGGRWQVREMEIRNRQSKTTTRLQFEFPEE